MVGGDQLGGRRCCVARAAPRFSSAELPTAPETEAFDSGASHKPAPDSSERHVFKAMSAAAIDARQRRHADRQTRRPVERALGHVEPVPRCCTILSTAKDAAGALLDHLMDVNNMPEPWMPRIENFEFPDPMGVISPPCTTSVVRTRPWVTRLRLRPGAGGNPCGFAAALVTNSATLEMLIQTERSVNVDPDRFASVV